MWRCSSLIIGWGQERPDWAPARRSRVYRQNDTRSRPFGIGATHTFEMFLIGDIRPYTYQDLILPDGRSRRLPAPVRRDDSTVDGDGWTLKAAPGWVVREGARRGEARSLTGM